jgi:hypothetical protein
MEPETSGRNNSDRSSNRSRISPNLGDLRRHTIDFARGPAPKIVPSVRIGADYFPAGNGPQHAPDHPIDGSDDYVWNSS